MGEVWPQRPAGRLRAVALDRRHPYDRDLGVVVGALERQLRDRLQQSKIDSISLGGDSQLGSSNLLEYRVAYNRSREKTPNEIELVFVQEDVEFAPNVSPESIDPDPSAAVTSRRVYGCARLESCSDR